MSITESNESSIPKRDWEKFYEEQREDSEIAQENMSLSIQNDDLKAEIKILKQKLKAKSEKGLDKITNFLLEKLESPTPEIILPDTKKLEDLHGEDWGQELSQLKRLPSQNRFIIGFDENDKFYLIAKVHSTQENSHFELQSWAKKYINPRFNAVGGGFFFTNSHNHMFEKQQVYLYGASSSFGSFEKYRKDIEEYNNTLNNVEIIIGISNTNVWDLNLNNLNSH